MNNNNPPETYLDAKSDLSQSDRVGIVDAIQKLNGKNVLRLIKEPSEENDLSNFLPLPDNAIVEFPDKSRFSYKILLQTIQEHPELVRGQFESSTFQFLDEHGLDVNLSLPLVTNSDDELQAITTSFREQAIENANKVLSFTHVSKDTNIEDAIRILGSFCRVIRRKIRKSNYENAVFIRIPTNPQYIGDIELCDGSGHQDTPRISLIKMLLAEANTTNVENQSLAETLAELIVRKLSEEKTILLGIQCIRERDVTNGVVYRLSISKN